MERKLDFCPACSSTSSLPGPSSSSTSDHRAVRTLHHCPSTSRMSLPQSLYYWQSLAACVSEWQLPSSSDAYTQLFSWFLFWIQSPQSQVSRQALSVPYTSIDVRRSWLRMGIISHAARATRVVLPVVFLVACRDLALGWLQMLAERCRLPCLLGSRSCRSWSCWSASGAARVTTTAQVISFACHRCCNCSPLS